MWTNYGCGKDFDKACYGNHFKWKTSLKKYTKHILKTADDTKVLSRKFRNNIRSDALLRKKQFIKLWNSFLPHTNHAQTLQGSLVQNSQALRLVISMWYTMSSRIMSFSVFHASSKCLKRIFDVFSKYKNRVWNL